MKKYLVGGAVRDMIMGREPHDLDYVVEADSYDDMVNGLKAEGYRVFLGKPEYFTARAKSPTGEVADFVLARNESESVYSDGRRPDSVKPGTIRDDLARRDFTMNAIALDGSMAGGAWPNVDIKGTLFDPYGGVSDIVAGVIRAVGDPKDRLREDALRGLRALRFSVTLVFDLDYKLHEFLSTEEFAESLGSVSVERIREELDKMFRHDTREAFDILGAYPLIQAAIFGGTDIWLLPTLKGR